MHGAGAMLYLDLIHVKFSKGIPYIDSERESNHAMLYLIFIMNHRKFTSSASPRFKQSTHAECCTLFRFRKSLPRVNLILV